jgi:heme a synthase
LPVKQPTTPLPRPVAILRWLTLVLVAAAYSTMVLGAYVKAIYGGLACPEWPTCTDGQFVVPLTTPQVAAELAHRTAATLVALTGLALLAWTFARFRGERTLLLLTLAAAGTLAVQIGLGAVTITSLLEPLVVTSHLAVATLFFGLTILIALKARGVTAVSMAPARATPEVEASKEPDPRAPSA